MTEQGKQEISVWIEGKDPRMEILSEEPLVMATPIGLLAGHRITPKESLFVRNIQDLPGGHTLEPRSLEGWEIELSGLIDPSRVVIRAEDLLGMDQVEYEMVLQCSGNGRFDVRRTSRGRPGARAEWATSASRACRSRRCSRSTT